MHANSFILGFLNSLCIIEGNNNYEDRLHNFEESRNRKHGRNYSYRNSNDKSKPRHRQNEVVRSDGDENKGLYNVESDIHENEPISKGNSGARKAVYDSTGNKNFKGLPRFET